MLKDLDFFRVFLFIDIFLCLKTLIYSGSFAMGFLGQVTGRKRQPASYVRRINYHRPNRQGARQATHRTYPRPFACLALLGKWWGV